MITKTADNRKDGYVMRIDSTKQFPGGHHDLLIQALQQGNVTPGL